MLQSLCKLTPRLLEKDYGLFPVRVPLTLTHGGHSQLQRPTWKYFTEDWKRTEIVQSSNPQCLNSISAYVGSVWAKVHLHLCNQLRHTNLPWKCRLTAKTTKEKNPETNSKGYQNKASNGWDDRILFLNRILKRINVNSSNSRYNSRNLHWFRPILNKIE